MSLTRNVVYSLPDFLQTLVYFWNLYKKGTEFVVFEDPRTLIHIIYLALQTRNHPVQGFVSPHLGQHLL